MRERVVSIASLAIALALSATSPSAQGIPRAEIEGKVLGWIKIYDYKGATVPVTQDQRVYSPAQLSIAQLFTNWMQASYLPTSALGDVIQVRNDKLNPYNQITAARPQSYGAYAKLYFELKYDANKKLTPFTDGHWAWIIQANGFYGIPTDALNTPEHYYFLLPTLAQTVFQGGEKLADDLEKAVDVSRHPVLGQFPAFYGANQIGGVARKYVLLSKDHKLPFIKITKGEYLQATEAAIARMYNTEKQKIARDNVGNQKSIDYFMGYLNTKNEKRAAVLKSNKEKYKDRLQETAEVFTIQPDAMLENYPDVFEGNGSRVLRLPVYTFDPRLAELCKTDAPQWITISWTATLNDPVSKSVHDAILNNLNVQYIYDYFFDPDKVKGQPYKPLRSPSFTEAAVAGKSSEAATKNAADPAVAFFEDFSASAVGKKPLNWKSTLDNTGATSVVTELKGLDGHWASMSGFQLTPTGMKTPLPRDFELSYDVIAAQNYTWGARGLTFKLTGQTAPGSGESFLSLRIRPGFGTREGEVVIEAQFPGAQGYLSGTKWVGAPGFSNTAQYNRVTVTIRKKGDLLQVFLDKAKIAEYEKGIPSGLQFTAMSFDLSGTSNSANDKMFISNIRIAAPAASAVAQRPPAQ
jgi:hypothetical protein